MRSCTKIKIVTNRTWLRSPRGTKKPSRAVHARQDAAREERNGTHQNKKSLRQDAMKNSQLRVNQIHPQTTKNSLGNHTEKCSNTKPAHPLARIFQPQPDGENGCQQADGGGQQPVRMFKKRATFPKFDGKREHIVAVARRPVGHGHPGFVAGHETSEADQQKRGERRQHGEPEQPWICFVWRVFTHRKKHPPRS